MSVSSIAASRKNLRDVVGRIFWLRRYSVFRRLFMVFLLWNSIGYSHGVFVTCLNSSIADIYKQTDTIYSAGAPYRLYFKDNRCHIKILSREGYEVSFATVPVSSNIYLDLLVHRDLDLARGSYSVEDALAAPFCFAKMSSTSKQFDDETLKNIKFLSDLMMRLYFNRPSFELVNKSSLLNAFNLLLKYDNKGYSDLYPNLRENQDLSNIGIMLMRILYDYGHYTLFDNLLVAEIYYLMQQIMPVVYGPGEIPQVLEVGAGNGVLASAVHIISDARNRCLTINTSAGNRAMIPDYTATDDYSDITVVRQRTYMNRLGIKRSVIQKSAQRALKHYKDARVLVAFNVPRQVINELYESAIRKSSEGPVVVITNSWLPLESYAMDIDYPGMLERFNYVDVKFFHIPIDFPSFPDRNHYLYVAYIYDRGTDYTTVQESTSALVKAIMEINQFDSKIRGPSFTAKNKEEL